MSDHGPFSYLVNCAGYACFQPFFETDIEEKFDRHYGINVKPAIYLTQAIAANLKSKNMAGSVVHISSQGSTIAMTEHLVYSSTKASIDHICRI
jgi:L-xylulose reductase